MDTNQHDDFYTRLRDRLTRWADRNELNPAYRDYILAVPDLFHLLCRLLMDRRVLPTDKALLGFAIAYVLSPLDLIPDWLGPLGYVDDLIVMVMVLDSILSRVPQRIVNAHWAGDGDLINLIRESLAKADDWVGKGMFRRIKRYLEKQGIVPSGAGKKTPAGAAGKKTPAGAAGKKTSATKTTAKKTASKKKASKKPTARKTARKATVKTVGPKTTGRTTSGRRKTASNR